MQRRGFIGAILAAMFAPFAARAQKQLPVAMEPSAVCEDCLIYPHQINVRFVIQDVTGQCFESQPHPEHGYLCWQPIKGKA